MAIKIPSKSILDRPTLNISNDNIYPEIEYSEKNNKTKYVSIYSNSVKCTNNTSVNTSYTIIARTDTNYENTITLYSGNISDYENFNDIKIENDSLKLLGVYNVYDSDNSTVRSDLKQFLFKTTIKKENVNIDYSTISISYNINQNILQTGIYPLNSLNRDAKNFLENQTVKEVVEEDKHYTVYFANGEDEALSFLGDKNTGEFVFYPKLTVQYCSIVNRDDDFDIYFYQSFYAKRTNAMGHYIGDLLNLYLDFSFDIYSKEIVSTSNNINENAKYSLSDNELLATQTKIADTDIYTQINNSIAKEFGKGKHSVDLTCLYMEYKDTNGQVVYSGKDGKMIAIGDEIEPYYYTDSEGDLPIGTYPNGDPLQFIVYSSEVESDDGVFIKNHIKAIEKIKYNYYVINFGDGISVTANGLAINSGDSIKELSIVEILKTSQTIDKVFINGIEVELPYKTFINGNIQISTTEKVGYKVIFPSAYLNITSNNINISSGEIITEGQKIIITPKNKNMIFRYVNDENGVNILNNTNVADFSVSDIVDKQKTYHIEALISNEELRMIVSQQVPTSITSGGTFTKTMSFNNDNPLDTSRLIDTNVRIYEDSLGDGTLYAQSRSQSMTFQSIFNNLNNLKIEDYSQSIDYGYITMAENTNKDIIITYHSDFSQLISFAGKYIVMELPVYEQILA